MRLRRRIWRGIGPLGRGIYWLFYLLWLVFAIAWRIGCWISDRWFVPKDKFIEWVLSDAFYSSARWKAVRNQRFTINRIKHGGRLVCERRGCGTAWADEYHGHHWYPRSTHPELALKLGNTGVLCAECNVGLGNRYVGRELRPNPRLAA